MRGSLAVDRQGLSTVARLANRSRGADVPLLRSARDRITPASDDEHLRAHREFTGGLCVEATLARRTRTTHFAALQLRALLSPFVVSVTSDAEEMVPTERRADPR
jgi:hypothetical protein